MLKLVAIGMWVILVTAGATFGAVFLGKQAPVVEGEQPDLGVEEMKSEMTSVPVVRGGDVVGYLILQLSFAADRRLLEEKKLDPLPFMKDAAFRVLFASPGVDVRRLRSEDLDTLTRLISEEANARIGAPMVRHVLLQQVNFVRKEDIRTHWIGGSASAE